MRIRRIEVTNFLCFRQLDVSVHGSLQILAGPNNAGKSSFVRLLEAFFHAFDGPTLRRLQPLNTYFRDAGPRTLSTIKVWFDDLSADELKECGEAVRKDGQLWVALRCSRGEVLSYQCSRSVSGDPARAIYEYVINTHQFVKVPSVRVGSAGDRDRPESLERLLDTLEALLIRRTSGPGTARQRAFSEKASELEAVVREVLTESAKSIHAELPFRDGDVSFRLPDFRYALRGMLEAIEIESAAGARVPVSERGTGFQSALVLGILRYVAAQEKAAPGQVIFAVEEPEAFLHPQTQRAMAAILRSISEDAQLFVTTHSSVVVDAFNVAQIARLPLMPAGTEFTWRPPELKEAEEGRLNRYCDAANSELVFANAVILVEGEGDARVVEWLLDDLCETPGGYYARGVSVIEVGGKGNLRHFVGLATLFGVKAHVLADKDALVRDRDLISALRKLKDPPVEADLIALREAADEPCVSFEAARQQQTLGNELLSRYGAWVFSSDLEGALVDGFGAAALSEMKGPDGAGLIDEAVAKECLADGAPEESLASRMGSKRWNAEEKPSGKAKPHWPRAVLEAASVSGLPWPSEFDDLRTWLDEILEGAGMAEL